MESLTSLLLSGERVLWSTHRDINYARRLPLIFCGIGGFMAVVALVYWYVPNWTGIFGIFGIAVSPLTIYLIYLACFFLPVPFAIYIALLFFKKGMKLTGLRFADLKPYHEIFALTDKRWIQKEIYRILTVNPSLYPPGVVTR